MYLFSSGAHGIDGLLVSRFSIDQGMGLWPGSFKNRQTPVVFHLSFNESTTGFGSGCAVVAKSR
jgi:hypothetical protein